MWTNDSALGGDRSGCVDVVTGNHSDGDAGFLTLFDGVGHFGPNWILDTDNAQAGQVVHAIGFVFPVWFVVRAEMDLIDFGFAAHEVSECNGDCSQTVTGHRFDYLVQQSLLHVASKLFEAAIVSVDESASKNKFYKLANRSHIFNLSPNTFSK